MVMWSIGSVANAVQNRVDDIPASISGAELIHMADSKRVFVEKYTGNTIGSTAIGEEYQGILVDLTTAELLNFMGLQGADVSSVKLGELSISKGAGGNLATFAKFFEERAMRELSKIGHDIRYGKAYD